MRHHKWSSAFTNSFIRIFRYIQNKGVDETVHDTEKEEEAKLVALRNANRLTAAEEVKLQNILKTKDLNAQTIRDSYPNILMHQLNDKLMERLRLSPDWGFPDVHPASLISDDSSAQQSADRHPASISLGSASSVPLSPSNSNDLFFFPNQVKNIQQWQKMVDWVGLKNIERFFDAQAALILQSLVSAINREINNFISCRNTLVKYIPRQHITTNLLKRLSDKALGGLIIDMIDTPLENLVNDDLIDELFARKDKGLPLVTFCSKLKSAASYNNVTSKLRYLLYQEKLMDPTKLTELYSLRANIARCYLDKTSEQFNTKLAKQWILKSLDNSSLYDFDKSIASSPIDIMRKVGTAEEINQLDAELKKLRSAYLAKGYFTCLDRAKAYLIFLEESLGEGSVTFLSDEHCEKLLSANVNHLDFVYDVFFQAIIVDPPLWTNTFRQAVGVLLDFVKSNNDTDITPDIIKQIEYLYNNRVDEQPEDMPILPSAVESLADLRQCACLLTHENFKKYFTPYVNAIAKIIVNEYKDLFNTPEACAEITDAKLKSFLERLVSDNDYAIETLFNQYNHFGELIFHCRLNHKYAGQDLACTLCLIDTLKFPTKLNYKKIKSTEGMMLIDMLGQFADTATSWTLAEDDVNNDLAHDSARCYFATNRNAMFFNCQEVRELISAYTAYPVLTSEPGMDLFVLKKLQEIIEHSQDKEAVNLANQFFQVRAEIDANKLIDRFFDYMQSFVSDKLVDNYFYMLLSHPAVQKQLLNKPVSTKLTEIDVKLILLQALIIEQPTDEFKKLYQSALQTKHYKTKVSVATEVFSDKKASIESNDRFTGYYKTLSRKSPFFIHGYILPNHVTTLAEWRSVKEVSTPDEFKIHYDNNSALVNRLVLESFKEQKSTPHLVNVIVNLLPNEDALSLIQSLFPERFQEAVFALAKEDAFKNLDVFLHFINNLTASALAMSDASKEVVVRKIYSLMQSLPHEEAFAIVLKCNQYALTVETAFFMAKSYLIGYAPYSPQNVDLALEWLNRGLAMQGAVPLIELLKLKQVLNEVSAKATVSQCQTLDMMSNLIKVHNIEIGNVSEIFSLLDADVTLKVFLKTQLFHAVQLLTNETLSNPQGDSGKELFPKVKKLLLLNPCVATAQRFIDLSIFNRLIDPDKDLFLWCCKIVIFCSSPYLTLNLGNEKYIQITNEIITTRENLLAINSKIDLALLAKLQASFKDYPQLHDQFIRCLPETLFTNPAKVDIVCTLFAGATMSESSLPAPQASPGSPQLSVSQPRDDGAAYDHSTVVNKGFSTLFKLLAGKLTVCNPEEIAKVLAKIPVELHNDAGVMFTNPFDRTANWAQVLFNYYVNKQDLQQLKTHVTNTQSNVTVTDKFFLVTDEMLTTAMQSSHPLFHYLLKLRVHQILDRAPVASGKETEDLIFALTSFVEGKDKVKLIHHAKFQSIIDRLNINLNTLPTNMHQAYYQVIKNFIRSFCSVQKNEAEEAKSHDRRVDLDVNKMNHWAQNHSAQFFKINKGSLSELQCLRSGLALSFNKDRLILVDPWSTHGALCALPYPPLYLIKEAVVLPNDNIACLCAARNNPNQFYAHVINIHSNKITTSLLLPREEDKRSIKYDSIVSVSDHAIGFRVECFDGPSRLAILNLETQSISISISISRDGRIRSNIQTLDYIKELPDGSFVAQVDNKWTVLFDSKLEAQVSFLLNAQFFEDGQFLYAHDKRLYLDTIDRIRCKNPCMLTHSKDNVCVFIPDATNRNTAFAFRILDKEHFAIAQGDKASIYHRNGNLIKTFTFNTSSSNALALCKIWAYQNLQPVQMITPKK